MKFVEADKDLVNRNLGFGKQGRFTMTVQNANYMTFDMFTQDFDNQNYNFHFDDPKDTKT